MAQLPMRVGPFVSRGLDVVSLIAKVGPGLISNCEHRWHGGLTVFHQILPDELVGSDGCGVVHARKVFDGGNGFHNHAGCIQALAIFNSRCSVRCSLTSTTQPL